MQIRNIYFLIWTIISMVGLLGEHVGGATSQGLLPDRPLGLTQGFPVRTGPMNKPVATKPSGIEPNGYPDYTPPSRENMEFTYNTINKMFPDGDNGIMRETAIAESMEGQDPNTGREGYSGGVFQVDEPTFLDLQKRLTTNPTQQFSRVRQRVQDQLGFDMADIQWEQLNNNPLLSGLFGRLLYSRFSDPIPKTQEGRAHYYKDHYNSHDVAAAGSANKYLELNKQHREKAEKLMEPSQKELQLGKPSGWMTPEGRRAYHNNRGGMSTEYSIGVMNPSINNGLMTHIPSIYDGKIVDQQTAEQMVIDNNGYDVETGRFITAGGDPEARSRGIQLIKQHARKPSRNLGIPQGKK